MSGILGIVNTDGAPVSRDLLAAMTEFLRFRGPDAENLWCESEVGFGHALLDTGGAGDRNKQPCSIDGRVWIVADTRIDARAELGEKLRAAGITVPSGVSDSQLILFAYQAWGKDSVRHLIGDFAFAIWDAPHKQLFCARDHFGVKPFYYANPPGSFVFSNTLNCLRLHPNVSYELNDLAICDYLLFGSNQDPTTTSFNQVQRLPPAHCLLCSEGEVSISRYWTLPQTPELRYRKNQEYIENFRVLLQKAVQDRVPAGPVAICISGGLDSSTVAATAGRMLGEGRKSRLHAYSIVYDRLIPDLERRFAGQLADFCDIPIHYLTADDYQIFQHWRDGDPGLSEPWDQPLRAIDCDLYQQISAQSRVVLTGEGGDIGLVPSSDAIAKLLRTGKLWNLAAGYVRCAFWQRCVPRVGLRTLLRSHLKSETRVSLPSWINPQIALKLELTGRLSELSRQPKPIDHPRSKAYNILSNGWWANVFEMYDAGNSLRAIDVRHPLFDIRLVDFLLSLPTFPWCIGKQIVREAMAGSLPPEVLTRRKTALAGDPIVELLQQSQSGWVNSFQPVPELLDYVAPSKIPRIAGRKNSTAAAWLNLRPLTLDHWLRTRPRSGIKVECRAQGGAFHGTADRAGQEEGV